MCERFSCLPSQLMDEDAELIRMVSMVDRFRPQQEGGVTDGE
jgi:hypothetical protein